MTDKPDTPSTYASPPCFAHELDRNYDGSFVVADGQQKQDVARWRKVERDRLIAARLEVPADERARCAEEVAGELDRLIRPGPGMTVSLYWPFKGEIDLRGWMAAACARGATIALPIVEEKAKPLTFRQWTPDTPMVRGVWNILQPEGSETVIPDIVIAPLVGHDPDCFRLGYGGGFFDRTLAGLATRRMVIGVGHPSSAIPTIFPQPHDVPMDVIVTGKGRVVRRG
jgi:5,10-methenyltetrahydrofolate synthetase